MLTIASFVAGFLGIPSAEDVADSVSELIRELILAVLAFIVCWGLLAFALTKAGFFEQAGKALASVVGALSSLVGSIWGPLARLVGL